MVARLLDATDGHEGARALHGRAAEATPGDVDHAGRLAGEAERLLRTTCREHEIRLRGARRDVAGARGEGRVHGRERARVVRLAQRAGEAPLRPGAASVGEARAEGGRRGGPVPLGERDLAGDEVDVRVVRGLRPGGADVLHGLLEGTPTEVVRRQRELDPRGVVRALLEPGEDPPDARRARRIRPETHLVERLVHDAAREQQAVQALACARLAQAA